MLETSFVVRTDAAIGTISPRLYGHFAEHLGRCCYDGLWVGTGRKDIPHYNGFRADVVDALKAMPVPMLRWPGGCYADHYHWRDGIGPERMQRLGMSCGLQVEDDNSLGTHEFMAFCRMIGAEPYLAGNVGSGTPQELCDWVEYCNSAVRTTLSRERAANGSPEPFGVKLWGVGNENWGCGGNYDAETYAKEYRRYATMLRHVDPTAELVACGHDEAWNVQFLKTNANPRHLELMDHFSIHRYWIHGGPELNFTEEQYYGLLAEAHATEEFVSTTAAHIRDVLGESKHKVGIALDEWGVWHPEARSWGPDHEGYREPITYEQAGTVRDAIATAIALEGFHHQCDVLALANLAQIVNVLHAPVMTEGGAMWLTPTYYVLQLHKPHLGASALPVDVTQGDAMSGSENISAVTATASTNGQGQVVTITNRHFSESASVKLTAPSTNNVVQAYILAGDSPQAVNSADNPSRVQLSELTIHADGANQWRIELPAHSVATIQFA
jgi:alpha-L-arabinofuranosidase